MWKLSVYILILLLIGIHAHFVERWSESQVNNMPYPVKIKDRIVMVGWHDRNILYVKSEPGIYYKNIGPCKIPILLDDGRMVLHPVSVARTLGNNKIVVSTLKLRSKMGRLTNFLIIVDPFDCTVKTVDISGRYGEIKFKKYPVVYQDHFDLFPNSYAANYSSIVRFNDKGEEMKVDFTFEPKLEFTDSRFFVENLHGSPHAGYLVTINNGDGMTMSLLSPKLKTRKQIVRRGAKALSTSTDFNNITVCYLDSKKLFCENLDDELNSRFKVPMAEIPNGTIHNAWAENLPGGRAVVLQNNWYDNLAADDSWYEAVHAQTIYSNGTVSEVLLVKKDMDADVLSKGYVMNNGDFCVGIVETNEKPLDEPSSGVFGKSDISVHCFKPQN